MIDLYPQEITRVFLNLISNGFYAATKRKAETGRGGFRADPERATKNLGDRVEIRIRDNGTGIPPEVREKMFHPFFTTKADRRGHRARPLDEPRHHRQAAWRQDRRRDRAGRIHRIHYHAAAYGGSKD